MAHSHESHKTLHKDRVARMTKGYKSGGAVHPDEAADKKLVKKMLKAHDAKIHGDKPKARADKYARGGRTKGGKTHINVNVMPSNPMQPQRVPVPVPVQSPPGAPPGAMPPGAAPPGGMPPGGAMARPPMPPGAMPGMMHNRGGRAFKKGGRVKKQVGGMLTGFNGNPGAPQMPQGGMPQGGQMNPQIAAMLRQGGSQFGGQAPGQAPQGLQAMLAARQGGQGAPMQGPRPMPMQGGQGNMLQAARRGGTIKKASGGSVLKEGLRNGTKVQHTVGKDHSDNLKKPYPITRKSGGRANFGETMKAPTQPKHGAGGGLGRLEKTKIEKRTYS